MTKKDYILIANVIANRFKKVDNWQFNDEKHHALTEIMTFCEDFITVLQKENPRFNRSRFIEYINKQRGQAV